MEQAWAGTWLDRATAGWPDGSGDGSPTVPWDVVVTRDAVTRSDLTVRGAVHHPPERGSRPSPEPPVGVVGACGGAGASTFAAVLAARLARRAPGAGRGSAALVDLDRAGGGLDVLLGLEAADGVRWPDLTDARGAVSGDELAALLPQWAGCAVLSADRARPGPPPPGAREDVLRALADRYDRVVLDLDRGDVIERDPAVVRCATVLVVAPRDLRGVAGVLALRSALRDTVGDVRLVVRGPAPGGLGAGELAHVVGLPLAVSMRTDRRLAAEAERGGGPARSRGTLVTAATRVARTLA